MVIRTIEEVTLYDRNESDKRLKQQIEESADWEKKAAGTSAYLGSYSVYTKVVSEIGEEG